MRNKFFTLLFAIVASTVLVNATTVTVNPGSNSLQSAVASATAGDVLELSNGTFTEHGDFSINKNLTIKAADGAKSVISNLYYFKIESGAKVTFQGIEFDGSGASDHCIRSYNGSTGTEELVLDNCAFHNYPGYVIYTHRNTRKMHSITIRNCIFKDNPKYSVAVMYEGSTAPSCDEVMVENSTFLNTTDKYAAIYIMAGNNTKLNVDHCTFHNFDSAFVKVDATATNVAISNCIFAQPTYRDAGPVVCSAGTINNCLAYNCAEYAEGPTVTACSVGNPLFVDATHGDFTLGAGSPALNAGTESSNLGDPFWWPGEEPQPQPVSGKYQIGDLYYNLDGDNLTAEVTSQISDWPYWSTTITTAVIPASVTYNNVTYSVTSIGDKAFSGCSGLTSVTIGNSVTSIGEWAFYDCWGLTSVTIGNSVTNIGSSAFYGCTGLTSVTIPNSVTSIGSSAFYNVPNIVYSGIATGSPWRARSVNGYVDGYLVYSDDTKTDLLACPSAATGEIVIPNSVTSIGHGAFHFCNNLTSITIPNSVTSIGNRAFHSCSGLTSVTIPNSVTSIGSSAFESCSGLISIEWNATNCSDFSYSYSSPFYNIRSQITSFTFGEAVEHIPANLCYGMNQMTSVTIPNSVTSIGSSAFENCSGLTSVIIGNSVTNIGSSAFSGCTGLTSVTIPNSVTSIGSRAFYGCSGLTSVTIPNSITSIEDYTFYGCSGLTSVTIPNSVTSIGNRAFHSCTSLTSVTIPNSVTSIGSYAFRGCTSMTSVTIPNSITSIEDYTFYGCSGLTSVTIPSSVTSIGNNAFEGCNALTDIYATCGDLERIKQLFNNDNRVKYKPLPYTITVNATNGSVSIPQNSCENLLTATANHSYYFTQWSDGITDNPRAIELTQDTTFTAEFSNLYNINVSCDEVYGIIDGENGMFEYLSEHTYEAISNYGYHFVQWSDGVTDNPRTITIIKDTSYQAIFAKNTYSITKNAEHGSVAGNDNAEYLDNIILTAIPDYGYHFTQWSNGNTDNPRTIELTQDTTFTAEFAKNTYTITTESSYNERGTTTGGTSALYLEQVEIAATANYGYHFARWNDNNTSNPRTITITEDKTYTAIFAKNTYYITKIANSEQGSISGSSQAMYLDEVTLTASPKYGYHFTQWSDGITNNPRTFTITQDTTFTAEFAVDVTGLCGDDFALTWTYNASTKLLTISGEGALASNYTFGLQAPENMQNLAVEDGVTAIGDAAFKGKQLKTIDLPNSLLSIGDSAFYDNDVLKNLTIPNSVTNIGVSAFEGGNRLVKIQLGENVETIENGAFKNCPYILEVYAYMEYPPIIDASVFTGCGDLSVIDCYVLEESMPFYRKTAVWKEFHLLAAPEPSPTAITNVQDDNVQTTKILRDNQIFILRGEKVYTLQGQEVR